MNKSDDNKTCFDDYDPNSLLVEQALQRIDNQIQAIQEFETLRIRDALGRVLAHDVESQINVPPHTNSAMDGYAVRGDDICTDSTVTLEVVGKVLAGAPIQTSVKPGQCVRIMTGGKMPDGTDTVIMQEHVNAQDSYITLSAGHTPGQNVRQAGEDIAIGQVILNKGKLLGAADIGLLASLGIAEVDVIRRLRVAFFSTGDELCPVGETLGDGQIYDSNRYTLFSLLTQFGAEIFDMGVIRDEPETIEAAFVEASTNADVLITTGGVSVGEADYVKTTLDRLGKVNFWKIAMKPGRPLAFGQVNHCQFFGLPGNPVSAMVTFYQFVLPALRKLSGQQLFEPLVVKLPCQSPLKKAPGRVEFQRGIIGKQADGTLTVRSTGQQGSGILSSMSQANCFIILPLECSQTQPGDIVDVQPFYGLF